MNNEKWWEMYNDIQSLKRMGFKKAAIARKLGINRKTVRKYFEMTPDEFQSSIETKKTRAKKTTRFENEILALLKEHSDFTAAQIFDRLLEKHSENFNVCESSIRAVVSKLRLQHNIPKRKHPRIYEEVEELPMGLQVQVDFGEIKVTNMYDKTIKLYVIAFILVHSRYKYCS